MRLREEAPKPKPKGRRRLSSGAALMASDSDEEEAKPKKKTNRRRSGVASSPRGKAALAAQLGSTCPRTRSPRCTRRPSRWPREGKINAKNAWNLPLIDHMRDVVKGEDSTDKRAAARGQDFQKASCTIEAGMKIYCSRVDDTLTTSYRVLESLQGQGRTMDDEEDNEPNENDDEATQAKKARKKKEKRRGDAASTLASLDRIDAKGGTRRRRTCCFRGSVALGGGGLTDGTSARAMLLLRLAAEGACVSFGILGVLDDGQDDAVVRAAVEGFVAYRSDGVLPRFITIKKRRSRTASSPRTVPEDEGASSRAPTMMMRTGVASTMVMTSVGIWRGPRCRFK